MSRFKSPAPLPKGWTLAQLRHVASIQNGADYKEWAVELGGYPVYGSGGEFSRSSRFLHDGESVLFGRKGTVDKPLHVSGKFWTVDTMFYTRLSPGVSGRFLYYCATTIPYSYYSTSTALPSMTQGDLASHPIALPPRGEQESIANFLDDQTLRIDRLIAKQTQLVETLRERRVSIISKTVSEGLTGEELRATGNPFLPFLPASWILTRFGREILINEGLVDPSTTPWSSMTLIAPNHIESLSGRITHLETAAEQSADSGKYLARRGQVLYSKIRPALNKVAIAPEDCLCSADMYAISSRTGTNHNFLAYWMRSEAFHRFASAISSRVKMPKLNRDELATAPWARPSIQEQEQIVAYLDDQTNKVDMLIERVEEHITLANERRAALITAAVTGRIDVHTSGDAARTLS